MPGIFISLLVGGIAPRFLNLGADPMSNLVSGAVAGAVVGAMLPGLSFTAGALWGAVGAVVVPTVLPQLAGAAAR